MGNHCERHHSCSSNVNYVNKTIYLPLLENQVRPSCNKCYYCLLSFLGFKVTKMTTGLSSSFIFFSNSSSSFFSQARDRLNNAFLYLAGVHRHNRPSVNDCHHCPCRMDIIATGQIVFNSNISKGFLLFIIYSQTRNILHSIIHKQILSCFLSPIHR